MAETLTLEWDHDGAHTVRYVLHDVGRGGVLGVAMAPASQMSAEFPDGDTTCELVAENDLRKSEPSNQVTSGPRPAAPMNLRFVASVGQGLPSLRRA